MRIRMGMGMKMGKGMKMRMGKGMGIKMVMVLYPRVVGRLRRIISSRAQHCGHPSVNTINVSP